MNTWCHGAPGIALGRVGTLDMLDDGRVRAEIEYALDTTLDMGLTPIDHLCCGNFGRAEILLTVGRMMARPGLVEAARVRVAMATRRAATTGWFGLRL